MRSVAITVQHDDVLSQRVDLLVLKHAQYLYGADRAAVDRLGIDSRTMPADGDDLLVPGRPMVGPEAVLFLGVPSLESFGYAEIRRFGRQALSRAAKVRPHARELSMTIHGPGYGLDELEAFESQVAGVLEAVAAHEIPEFGSGPVR